ncbi:MAG: flagellar basal-body MS-ring/collar protein FliF [Phenylobacterium sp.]|uniref:flagellar basal-body MS-ring/collar protein FliF n=1 Tax=Phenylobacterium sp. TaxID=1871053 RepID=UPI0027199129|nr:flagellar basal-body MS-ring/collar protein FliF [Phenylobacterium sp.]MDO8902233.1 flagellar basal-body MS-ring/collar protein FliF [Phenylobacterium sp.]MDP2213054.1 flagellar basal-body MS-ring/collar protein FliF [Phenylobacterium sp.]
MNQFVAALQRFGIGRLAAILGIGAGVAAALIAVTMNLGQPKALLYSNLDMREAGSITQALEQARVKYEVKGDGSTILVNRDEVASTRLLLSSQGLPTAGSVGYEIFDNSSALGQTDFVQQLNRQRALEGELARTIRGLDGVTSARVHLVLPKRQLFEEAAEEPSASITMGVGGRAPTPEQVRAVQNLVAGAVPRMTPARVTVVDQHGKTLSAGGESFAGEIADSRKSEVEQRIAKTVKAMVESVVGPGKARVNVTAELDLARVTLQEETYDPDGQVVRSEQTVEENANETEANNNGMVTADANIPGGLGAPEAGGGLGSASGRTESTTNYEISKKVRTEVNEPGRVQRLSVAVAVDGVRPIGEDGRPGEYAARSEDEMARIEQLVRTAVGYNEERGDQVTVINMPFDSPVEMGGVESGNPLTDFDKNDIMRAVELAILAIVALLIVFFVVRPLLKSAGGGSGGGLPMQTITRVVTTTPDGQTVQVAVDPETGQPLALPNPGELEQKIDIARIEGQVKASSVKRVADFVETHPEQSVSILRSWLHESA